MKTKIEAERPMFDHTAKMYVRVQLSQDKKCYQKWVSKNKKDWKLSETFNSLDEVMKSQQELINGNYRNLFKVITEV